MRYIWRKYSINTSYYYTLNPWTFRSSGTSTSPPIAGYTSYSLNSSTGQITLTGSYVTRNTGQSGYVYLLQGSVLFRDGWINSTTWEQHSTTSYQTSSRSRGSFIENVIAEQGTYPNNGIQGGYWYVLVGPAFSDIRVKIDDVWKEGDNGWVKVDGVWKNIEGIWGKVDGVWKES
jgi:hypothetical protein